MKIQINLNESTSKSKKNNPRSKFLSALMKNLGGDSGDAVAKAFVEGNAGKFKSLMSKITDKIASGMSKE